MGAHEKRPTPQGTRSLLPCWRSDLTKGRDIFFEMCCILSGLGLRWQSGQIVVQKVYLMEILGLRKKPDVARRERSPKTSKDFPRRRSVVVFSSGVCFCAKLRRTTAIRACFEARKSWLCVEGKAEVQLKGSYAAGVELSG